MNFHMNRTGSKLNLHPFWECFPYFVVVSPHVHLKPQSQTHKRCQTELIIPHDSYYIVKNVFVLHKVKGKVKNQGKYMLLCGNDLHI